LYQRQQWYLGPLLYKCDLNYLLLQWKPRSLLQHYSKNVFVSPCCGTSVPKWPGSTLLRNNVIQQCPRFPLLRNNDHPVMQVAYLLGKTRQTDNVKSTKNTNIKMYKTNFSLRFLPGHSVALSK
jgi:hypothetical protein